MKNNRAYVAFEVEGKKHVLKYDFNAVADLEDYYNTGLFNLIDENNVGLRTLRGLLWAGLKWSKPKYSIQEAGKIIEAAMEEGYSFQELFDLTITGLKKAKFIQEMTGEAEEVEEAEKNE